MVRQTQTQTSVRCHFTPLQWLLSKKQNNKHRPGCGTVGTQGTLLVGMENGRAAVENSILYPKKLKVHLPWGPAIPPLRIYTK